jgi:SAM-dependent methyltransferase
MSVAPEPLLESDPALTARPGLVLLKLFIPPHYYGDYLVFLPDGMPIGVVSPVGAEVLRRAKGAHLSSLLTELESQNEAGSLVDVFELLEYRLLVPGDTASELQWICPDQGSGTRHTGDGARLFIEYFHNYLALVFHEGSFLVDSHDEFLPAISKYFPRGGQAVCLDAGCGSGHYGAALARLGHHVYACDISSVRLASAASHDCEPGFLELIECNLEHIPLPNGSVDFAMCNFVLEHVADPYAVVDELGRLLCDGGRLVLVVPAFNVRDTLAAWLHGEVPSLNFEHLRSYGLIPNTHPWCEPILTAIHHLACNSIVLEAIEGMNILTGLWEPWTSALGAIAQQCGPAFPFIWPWNCLGQQVLFSGRKHSWISQNNPKVWSCGVQQ